MHQAYRKLSVRIISLRSKSESSARERMNMRSRKENMIKLHLLHSVHYNITFNRLIGKYFLKPNQYISELPAQSPYCRSAVSECSKRSAYGSVKSQSAADYESPVL